MAAEQPDPTDEPNTPESPAPAPSNRKERRANAVIKRKTKHKEVVEELQQPDQFQQQGRPIVEWVLDHTRHLAIAVGVILGILFLWGIADSMSSGSRKEAAEALFKARRSLPALTTLPGDDVDEQQSELTQALTALEAVAVEHDGTPQGTEARLDAGNAAYRLGDYDKALAHFEAVSSAKGLTGTLALNGKAYALESKGDLAGALTALESLRGRTKGGDRAQATLDLARVASQSGDTDKARGLLAAFEEEFPDSLLLPDAKARLAALK